METKFVSSGQVRSSKMPGGILLAFDIRMLVLDRVMTYSLHHSGYGEFSSTDPMTILCKFRDNF